MGCSCDSTGAAFETTSIRRARKQHRCCECGEPIEPGDTYQIVEGMWEGDFATFKTCERCVELWKILMDAGWCQSIGDLRETWQEHWTRDTPRPDMAVWDKQTKRYVRVAKPQGS